MLHTAAPRCVPAAATSRLTSPVVLPKEGGPPVGRGDSGRPISLTVSFASTVRRVAGGSMGSAAGLWRGRR